MSRRDYTIIVYKKDKRSNTGERFVRRIQFNQLTEEEAVNTVRMLQSSQYSAVKHRVELHETWVTRFDSQTGNEFKEHFETPFSCSRASESYYAM